MARPQVLLATEGTYPFHQGGVSTWCDALVHRLPEVDFVVFAIAMNPYVATQFEMPANVKRIVAVPLWGMQDPSEHRDELAYSEIFLQKQRTGPGEIRDLFLPAFEQFLRGVASDEPGQIGEALARMYRYFRTYDYQTTFKSQDVWEVYKTWVLGAARRDFWTEPTIFEEALPPYQWTIVSPVQQYSEVLSRGWHDELASFVTTYSIQEAENPHFTLKHDARFPILTPDVFLFVEPHLFPTGQAVSKRDLTLPVAGGAGAYAGASFRAVEARAYYWALAYHRAHPKTSQFYVQGRDLMVLWIRQ